MINIQLLWRLVLVWSIGFVLICLIMDGGRGPVPSGDEWWERLPSSINMEDRRVRK